MHIPHRIILDIIVKKILPVIASILFIIFLAIFKG